MGAIGFDDSPVWKARRGLAPRVVTLVYPYYDNAKFLQFQLERWTELASSLRSMLRIIIVDDGSPTTPAFSVIGARAWPLDICLYRIEVDVRWNWLAARNIGMQHAVDGWCVLTDMDHVLSADTIKHLIYDAYDERAIYRFNRIEHTGERIHPHPNSMFMTRATFWKAGGYDEALSGFYGTDGDWRRRCAATAKVYILQDELVRHEHQGDSSTTRYLRKQLEDAGKKPIIKLRGKGWKPKTLSFPYHQVSL